MIIYVVPTYFIKYIFFICKYKYPSKIGEKGSNVFLENGEKADPNGRDSSHQ